MALSCRAFRELDHCWPSTIGVLRFSAFPALLCLVIVCYCQSPWTVGVSSGCGSSHTCCCCGINSCFSSLLDLEILSLPACLDLCALQSHLDFCLLSAHTCWSACLPSCPHCCVSQPHLESRLSVCNLPARCPCG